MKVYQIRVKLYCRQNIAADLMQNSATFFIDTVICTDEKYKKLHEQNTFKNYCYDLPYPMERNKIYQKGKMYTLTIRTIDEKLAQLFKTVCADNTTNEFKGLETEMRILPPKIIEFAYSLTPMIIKSEQGYWRNSLSEAEFAQRLKSNLIKKWQTFTGKTIDSEFELFSTIEFLNKAPVAMKYKDITLLGDKIRLSISDNKTAQELAYMALGTGIGEINSRGAGFLGYRWL